MPPMGFLLGAPMLLRYILPGLVFVSAFIFIGYIIFNFH